MSIVVINTGSRLSGMVQCRKNSSSCSSDRLTANAVAATVAVTAEVTVLATAAVTVPVPLISYSLLQLLYSYGDSISVTFFKTVGAAATSPPTAGGGTCLFCGCIS